MGSQSIPSSVVTDALFSTAQQRLLALLFGAPGRTFRSSELLTLVNSGVGGTQRALARMVAADLVTMSRVGNQKHYQANSASPVFPELHSLVVKTVGLIEPLRHALAKHRDEITAAFVYGSVASATERGDSDIDLMVISESLRYPDVIDAVASAEELLSRKINPTLYSAASWKRRLHDDSFVSRVVSKPRMWVFGGDDALQ